MYGALAGSNAAPHPALAKAKAGFVMGKRSGRIAAEPTTTTQIGSGWLKKSSVTQGACNSSWLPARRSFRAGSLVGNQLQDLPSLKKPSSRWLQVKMREDILQGQHRVRPSIRVYVVSVSGKYYEIEALHSVLLKVSALPLHSAPLSNVPMGPAAEATDEEQGTSTQRPARASVSSALKTKAAAISENTDSGAAQFAGEEPDTGCELPGSVRNIRHVSVTGHQKAKGGKQRADAAQVGRSRMAGRVKSESKPSNDYFRAASYIASRGKSFNAAIRGKSFNKASMTEAVSKFARSFMSRSGKIQAEVTQRGSNFEEDEGEEDEEDFSFGELEASVQALLVAQRLHVMLSSSIQIRQVALRFSFHFVSFPQTMLPRYEQGRKSQVS